MKQKYLRIKITGGLGNQLFKFFSAYRFAHENDRKLIIDTTWYRYSQIGGGLVNSRDYLLNNFSEIKLIECMESRNWRFHKRHGQLMRKLPKAVRESAGYFMDDVNPKFKSKKSRVIFDGSFEDVSLLPDAQSIMRVWNSSNLENSHYRKYLDQILKIKPLIIHVRLTDYLNLSHIYDVLTREYYLQAIEKSESSFGQKPIWLFSDDANKAVSWLNLGNKISKVFPTDTKLNPIQILDLMSYSSQIIIAHSTFSWWAAYLGSLRGQIDCVYMPSRFFKDKSEAQNKLKVIGWQIIKV